ncbi:MAG: integrase catalytic protein [Spirosoma sp.]|nr:integrase catalytic protein [Spirosoma sp.]
MGPESAHRADTLRPHRVAHPVHWLASYQSLESYHDTNLKGGPGISRSRTRVGIISRRCWMTIHATSWLGIGPPTRLCPGMQATDVERTVQLALQASSLTADQRPRMLSDNGSAYVSRYLKEYLEGESIEHIRSAPFHPMTQPGRRSGQNRAVSPVHEKCAVARALLQSG